MELKEFAKAAKAARGRIIITQTPSGYCMKADCPKLILECLTRDEKLRKWRSLDTLLKHLVKAGYTGEIRMKITNQIEIPA